MLLLRFIEEDIAVAPPWLPVSGYSLAWPRRRVRRARRVFVAPSDINTKTNTDLEKGNTREPPEEEQRSKARRISVMSRNPFLQQEGLPKFASMTAEASKEVSVGVHSFSCCVTCTRIACVVNFIGVSKIYYLLLFLVTFLLFCQSRAIVDFFSRPSLFLNFSHD